MARRQRLCPEITDPELRGFLDMLPDLRAYGTDLVMNQERKARMEEISLPGRKISVCFHTAKDPEGRELPGRRPVLFEFHGGGFMMGNAEKTDGLCERLARNLGIHVVGVNYRLAPENPFPAAVKDAYDIIRRMRLRSEDFRIDPDKIAVMGYSAGATLSTAAAMQVVLNGEFHLRAQILHYPYLDAVHLPDEKKHYDCDMANEVMKAFTLLYSTAEERYNPYVSPVLATDQDLKGTAPALILPAESDSLREEGVLYAEHLKDAGVETELEIMPHAHHGYLEDAANWEIYLTTPREVRDTHDPAFRDQAESALALTEDFLRRRLELQGGGQGTERDEI